MTTRDCANDVFSDSLDPNSNNALIQNALPIIDAPTGGGLEPPANAIPTLDDINQRLDVVKNKLDALAVLAKNPAPDPWDDRNIIAGDMDSLRIGGSQPETGGAECDFELTIKANTYVSNVTMFAVDKCELPNEIIFISEVSTTSNSELFTFNGFTPQTGQVIFSDQLGEVIIKPVTKTSIEGTLLDITSTTLNITTAGSSVTIDGTTWQSILDRLSAVELAAAAAQSTADGKVSLTTFNNHTHGAGTLTGVANGEPVDISGTTSTP